MTTGTSTKNTQGTKDTIAIVSNALDGFNKRDFDRACRDIAPDFELLDAPTGMTFQGPDGLRQWFNSWLAWTSDGSTGDVQIHAGDDWVVSEHVGRGTHTGPLSTPTGTIPATHRKVQLPLAEVTQLRDGKIVRMRAYWDTGTLMRQLGVMP
jgi:steroid delta-isomerase-like uncharacterized protein